MIRKIIFCLFAIFSTNVLPVAAQDCPIVPLPAKISQAKGMLDFRNVRSIIANNTEVRSVALYFQKEVLQHTGLALSFSAEAGKGKSVILELNTRTQMPAESYTLSIDQTHVRITSANSRGLFNGVVSLLQLVRLSATESPTISIPCWQIEDSPAMAWRGLMLDESRNFFGKETVKQILDWMAFYKLNRFHWHLTDVPGWRIEIKKYPKLAVIGGVGNINNPLEKSSYYTHEDISEIVRYAAERHIEVIPEIDMPGHAAAANKAYPEYSGGGLKSHPDFTFNPGKEDTYSFLTHILKEIDVLFPFKMIHIGGDEVHFGNESWNTNQDVQNLMKSHNLNDLKSVESYFIRRMADSLAALNTNMAGWDEIAAIDLPKSSTTIFWWRHDKEDMLKKALDNGYSTVLSPRIPLYLDFIQDSTHISGRKWGKNFSSLQSLYNFSIKRYPDIIDNSNRNLILGIQANIWTEQIATDARLQYMIFPRISALAEAAWTDSERRDENKYMDRLTKQEILYQKAGLFYYNAKSPYLTPEIINYQPEKKIE